MSKNINYGPLLQLSSERGKILKDTNQDLLNKLEANRAPGAVLEDALFLEQQRLEQTKFSPFLWRRNRRDQKFWQDIKHILLQPQSKQEQLAILQEISNHYLEEIGGHFKPPVYHFAIQACPHIFSWIFNASSMRQFIPWKMKQYVQSFIQIEGEVDHLRKLSQKGTILLVPTHQSNIDSILVGYVIYLMGLPPFCYGAGLNLFTNPVLSFFMSSLGAYTIDRQKQSVLYKDALKQYSTSILQRGMHSVFFPGGGRSRSGAIENKVKLGLLGTGLHAQIQNLRLGKQNPNVYVVPLNVSFHFVLEAESLILEYLAQGQGEEFSPIDEDPWPLLWMLRFVWKFLSVRSSVVLRVGRPLDVFGNDVDENGLSVNSSGALGGSSGSIIDTRQLLISKNEVIAVPERDHGYIKALGAKMTERYYEGNVVLTSHIVAFSFFEALRKKNPEMTLIELIRLPAGDRILGVSDVYLEIERVRNRLRELKKLGKVNLSKEAQEYAVEALLESGAKKLGALHDTRPVRLSGYTVTSDNLNTLYYYRNRLSGYGLSLLAEQEGRRRGQQDSLGFLA